MFFEFCKCPKCGNSFQPDYDSTISSYINEEFSSYLIMTSCPEAPEKPDYLIFKCMQCDFSQKIKDIEVLQMIREGWANMAWQQAQQYLKDGFVFENYVTRYLIDNDLGKVISNRDLVRNPLLKSLLKAKEIEQRKFTKKIND